MRSSRPTRSWSRTLVLRAAAPLAVLASVLIAAHPAPAQTMYGTLSNFDVFNNTGQECHGFEIELDGVSSADVSYTFGAPYNRYGNPRVVDFPGGVYIRYLSPYDAGTGTFTQATPMAPATVSPTDGHACYAGGPIGNYDTSGCEHFGIGINGNPTRTVYNWLVADPASPGSLSYAATKVNIPAPTWNVVPNPVGGQPVVAAVIQAEPPQAFEFGDAQWVKVFKTELPNRVELAELVTDSPAVPQEAAETEVEWVLLQSSLGAAGQLEGQAELGAGNEAVIRRYEYYEYTGAYDPETHEAMPLVADDNPQPGEIGNYIGAQMAAVNLAPPAPPAPLTIGGAVLATGEIGFGYSAALVTGGLPPYVISLSKGAFPAGLGADALSGLLEGTPTRASGGKFTVLVTDQNGDSVTGVFSFKIVKAVGISTHSLPVARMGKAYKTSVKASNGKAPYAWSLVSGSLPDGLSLDSVTGVISGVPTTPGASDLVFQVTDSVGGEAQGHLFLTVK